MGHRSASGLATVLCCALLPFALACGDQFAPDGTGGGPSLPPTEPFSLSAGTTGAQHALGVAVDGEGNIVVTGHFVEQLDLGGGPLLGAGTYSDIFLAKFDPHGGHLWSKRFGDTNVDRGVTVAVDDEGNILLGATFAGLMEFDGQPLQAQGQDILLAKFSGAGEHLWHRVFTGVDGDTTHEEPYDLALDPDGNIILAGRFAGTLVIAEEHSANEDRHDAFVAKLDPQGEPLWSLSFGGVADDWVQTVAVGPGGNVAVTGTFAGLANVAGTVWNAPDLGSPVPNAYLLQLAPDGSYLWGKNLGDTAIQYGGGIVVDDAGETYGSGSFAGGVDFGGDQRSSHGSQDVYLTRYDSDGGLGWVWHAGDVGVDMGRHVALAPDGQLVFGGDFTGSLEFGTDVLRADDGADLFVAALDTDAHVAASRSFGGTADERMTDMAVDAAGSIVVVGFFEGTVDFGQGPLSSQDGEDLFIAKLSL